MISFLGALKVFDEDMRKDLVKPNRQTYIMLIHACGKVGYSYKAHFLIKNIIDQGRTPTISMFTDAFIACAKCPPGENYFVNSISMIFFI